MVTVSEVSLTFALAVVVVAVAVTVYHSRKIKMKKMIKNMDEGLDIFDLKITIRDDPQSIIFSISVVAVGIFLYAVAMEIESDTYEMMIELYKIALPLNLAAVAVYLVVFALMVPNPKFMADQKNEGMMILWLSMASLVVGFLGFGFCYAVSGTYGIETKIILFTLEFAFILYIIKRTIEVIPDM